MTPLQPIVDKVSEDDTRALWEQCGSVDQFLDELRRRGAFQIESIKAVRKFAKVDLGKAKEIVHYSKTWADLRESSEALHEALYQAALADGWVDVSAEHAEHMVKTGT
jgi:ribosomal protein L7/L12